MTGTAESPIPLAARVAIVALLPLLGGCLLAIGNKIPEAAFHDAEVEFASDSSAKETGTSTATAKVESPPTAGSPEAAKKQRDLERELDRERRKLEIAELEGTKTRFEEERDAVRLSAELETATAKLAIFRDMTLPTRAREADLELESQVHRLADAEAELRQLEMLYTGAELEDRTDEIVLERGRRQLAHARARVEVAQAQRDRVVEKELPLELAEKARELATAQFAVEKHQRGMEISRRKHSLELDEMRAKVADSERALAELAAPAASAASAAAPSAPGNPQ